MKKQQKEPSPEELSKNVDSPEDQEKMEPETTSINIPDAREIEGQEDINPLPQGEQANTTVASADEEGEAVFDEDALTEGESNVSEIEKDTLHEAANDMPGDDENLRRAALDSEDYDGTPLNEDSFDENISPNDLDVPGAGLDDADERIGSEDEENNEYSLGGEDNEMEDEERR